MSLNSMRQKFQHTAKWIMGFVTVAMVVTTYQWNQSGNSGGCKGPEAVANSSEDVVVTVDKEKLIRAEYQQQFNEMKQGMEQRMGGRSIGLTQLSFFRPLMFNQMIDRLKVIATADSMGIKASEQDILNFREKFIKDNKVRESFGLSPKASMSEVEDAMAKNGKPLSTVLPDEKVRQMVIQNKLQQMIDKQVNASEQDVRNSFKEYHTRHILIDNKKRSDEQALKMANDIIAKATAPGADFAALAKKFSEDPGTKNKGGDDDWIDYKKYVPEFNKAAFALNPGQITTTPVKSNRYGYFIIKLEAVRDKLPADFDKKKADYTSEYVSYQRQIASQAFMESVQARTYKIDIKDPGLKADKALTEVQQMKPDDPTRTAKLQAIIADYQKALGKASAGEEKAQYNVAMAQVYGMLKDTNNQIKCYNNALKEYEDVELRMALGDLYKEAKDTKSAIEQYQKASTGANWDDVSTHQRLKQDFEMLGRKDLADGEKAWIDKYNKENPPAPTTGGMPGAISMPGGKSIKLETKPAAANTNTKAEVKTVPAASGKPAAVKPAQ